MPSTRGQKAKARKSREMDMMSDIDNLDVMLGSGNENPIERELADAIEQSSESKVTTGQMNVKGTIIESLHKKMNPLGKMKTDSILRTLQANLILDCPKRWIP